MRKAYKDSKLCNLLMALQIHRQRPELPVVAWSQGLYSTDDRGFSGTVAKPIPWGKPCLD